MHDERDVFILADRELREIIDRIEPDQWDRQVPGLGPPDQSFTLREIVDYQAYDEAWVPAMMEGRTMEEVGPDAFGERLGGEVLGDAPQAEFSALVDAAIAAVRGVPDEELDSRIVHFSYGDYPVREALRHIASFRGLRVHDLAEVLGLDVDMSDDLVRGLWEMLEPRIDEYRAMGVFPPEIEVAEDAPLRDRLLGMTGRHP